MINLEYLRKKKIKLGSNPEVVNYINSLYDDTASFYLKNHKDWYINDRFVRGDHWMVYNKTYNRIQSVPIASGEVRRTINKIRSQIRGIKNFIKRSQPRWEVHPNNASDEAYKEAELKNKLLQNLYNKTGIKRLLTDLIINSLKYSTGFIECSYGLDDNGNEGLMAWVNSTYDILPDPSGANINDCRYIIKTSVKPVEAILNNKDYKIEDKGITDNKEAASEYKNILELENTNRAVSKTNKDLETAVIKELYLKFVDKDGNNKIRIITVCGNNVAMVYEPKYRKYPIIAYSPERDGDSIFSQPWIKDLISINKSLDKTASQVESYIQRMLAGKYLIKKGVETSTITDRGAEMIYYKGMTPPKQMDLQPLPSTPFSYIGNLERWIEELGGVREASLGRAAGSLQSGKGIEALQGADESTVAEPIENLELCLKEVGEFFLDAIADNQMFSKTLVEGKNNIKYVGDIESPPPDALVIKGSDDITVVIVPEVSYSESTKKEWLFKLADAKLIDSETVLEQFKFSNISDIVARMEKNKEEEFKKEMMKQRESHRTDGNGPEDTADLADQENMQMASGQQVPETPKALWSKEHTDLHIAFVKENIDAYKLNKDLFDSHINAEQQYQQ